MDITLPERSKADTEHERTAVNQNDREFQKSALQVRKEQGGFCDRLQEMNTDMVVEQAVRDRMQLEEMKTEHEQAEVEDAIRTEYEDEARREAGKSAHDVDDDLERLRAARRNAMKDKQKRDEENKMKGHGEYSEIVEDEFLKTVTSSKLCVVHFFHRQFERCKIMDMHLQKLAPRFIGTRFVSLNAEKAPFFVQKLAVKTLPTAVYFIDGVAVAKQMGFQGLPNGDEFRTVDLARTLRENMLFDQDFDSDDESWD